MLLDGLTCGSYTLWGYHETGAGDINALDGVDDDDLVATARTLEIVEGPRAEETLTLE